MKISRSNSKSRLKEKKRTRRFPFCPTPTLVSLLSFHSLCICISDVTEHLDALAQLFDVAQHAGASWYRSHHQGQTPQAPTAPHSPAPDPTIWVQIRASITNEIRKKERLNGFGSSPVNMSLEKLFIQFFERKDWIIEQAQQQADAYTEQLASRLLIDGITPPPCLLNPRFNSGSSHPHGRHSLIVLSRHWLLNFRLN